MSGILAFSMVLAGQSSVTATVSIPVYDFDHKTNAVRGGVPTKLPTGFKDVKPGTGKLESKFGTISFSLSKSGQPIPTPQRNPEAKKGEEWSTIRLVKWIGWRNTKGTQEFYKLNWSSYRVNAVLSPKTKSDLPELRKALGVLCDNLTF